MPAHCYSLRQDVGNELKVRPLIVEPNQVTDAHSAEPANIGRLRSTTNHGSRKPRDEIRNRAAYGTRGNGHIRRQGISGVRRRHFGIGDRSASLRQAGNSIEDHGVRSARLHGAIPSASQRRTNDAGPLAHLPIRHDRRQHRDRRGRQQREDHEHDQQLDQRGGATVEDRSPFVGPKIVHVGDTLLVNKLCLSECPPIADQVNGL